MPAELRLRPFHPDALPELLHFIRAHPVAELDAALVRELLTRLPRSPEHVLDLHHGDDRLLVATVVDTLANASNSALLEVLGARELTPSALEVILGRAEQLARRGPCRRLEIVLPPSLQAHAPVLAHRGYHIAFRQYHMTRPSAAPPDPAPALPADGRWADATLADVPTYHALVARAFADIPGTHLADLPTFRAMFERNPRRPRLLFHRERMVGFVKTLVDGDTGLVHTLGRDPDHRGHGLGPILLHEAMRVLARDGARHLRLEVIAHNRSALALYLDHGFTVAREEPTYQRDLADEHRPATA